MAGADFPTVDRLFLRAATRYPDRAFIRQPSNPRAPLVTYRDAARRVAESVQSLRAQGIRQGHRLICYTEAIEPSIYFHLACASAGVVSIPFSPTFSHDAIREALERTEASGVWSNGEARIDRVKSITLDPRVTISFAAALELLESAERTHGPDDVYMFQPTSGSTGKSKYVMRTHAAFGRVAPIIACDLSMDAPEQERLLMGNPLTHGLGQYLMSTVLHLGACMCVPSKQGMESRLEELRSLDPTYLTFPPRVIRALWSQYQTLGGAKMFGPSLKILGTGGAAADAAILEQVVLQGVDVVDGYGASEYSVVAMTDRRQWRAGYLGKVLPDVELKNAEDGELLAKTPVFMKGYFGDRALTSSAYTPDGFFRTGDYCEITPDGYLRFAGRKTDVFNTFEGTNVHPARIEKALEELPWVNQAILIGDGKPFISALLSVKGPKPSEEQVRRDVEQVNAALERVERVQRWVLFTDAFPKTVYAEVAQSKIRRDRKAIDQLFAEQIRSLYTERGA